MPKLWEQPRFSQEAICDGIRDVPGAINISDDIIVFGVNRESHEKALRATLDCLNRFGLTMNKAKEVLFKPP